MLDTIFICPYWVVFDMVISGRFYVYSFLFTLDLSKRFINPVNTSWAFAGILKSSKNRIRFFVGVSKKTKKDKSNGQSKNKIRRPIRERSCL
eukprot:maker-scaffold_11-snap-gene-10.6-mRNA-1 protein AED:0.08 eAED:0.15 QI:0/0.66/0.75/1/0.33/0.25/4/665/91